jgi:hypothetical protein
MKLREFVQNIVNQWGNKEITSSSAMRKIEERLINDAYKKASK